MQWIHQLAQWYIKSSLHVAISAVSLLVVSCFYFSIPLNHSIAIMVFLGTICCYNFMKYYADRSLEFRANSKLILTLSAVAGAIAAVILMFQGWEVILTMVVLTGICSLYALPLLFKRNLRAIPILKVIIVALVWSGTTVLLPMEAAGLYKNSEVYFFMAAIFLLIYGLCIPFEIRDLNYDEEDLKTIPQLAGIHGAKAIGILAVLGSLAIILSLQLEYQEISIFIHLLAILFILLSNKTQSWYYASFTVESLPILWLISLDLFY